MMQFHITLIMMSKFIMKIVCYFKKHFVTRIRNFVFTYRKSIERKCPVTSTFSVHFPEKIFYRDVIRRQDELVNKKIREVQTKIRTGQYLAQPQEDSETILI